MQDRLAAELRPRLRRSTLAAGSAPPQRSSGFAARVVQRALDMTSAPEVHRPALVAELRDRPNEFDIQVQLSRDLDRMLVEDVTIEWPEALSPFVTVAKLRIPQQDISDADNLDSIRLYATEVVPALREVASSRTAPAARARRVGS